LRSWYHTLCLVKEALVLLKLLFILFMFHFLFSLICLLLQRPCLPYLIQLDFHLFISFSLGLNIMLFDTGGYFLLFLDLCLLNFSLSLHQFGGRFELGEAIFEERLCHVFLLNWHTMLRVATTTTNIPLVVSLLHT